MKYKGRSSLTTVVGKIVRLLQFLASRRFGATNTEIQKEMDCSLRQVYRYMQSLNAAGVRVVQYKSIEQFSRKRWKIVDQQEFFKHIGIL